MEVANTAASPPATATAGVEVVVVDAVPLGAATNEKFAKTPFEFIRLVRRSSLLPPRDVEPTLLPRGGVYMDPQSLPAAAEAAAAPANAMPAMEPSSVIVRTR
jgi:hypothetical protein